MPIKDPIKRREAHRKYMKEVWYPKNKEKHIERVSNRKSKPGVRKRTNELAKAKREETKAWVIQKYGGRCSCSTCPETDIRFLTLDHVSGDGNIHRRSMKYGLWSWAKKHGCPDTLRLMCWNCNCGRYHNGGTCPHELRMSGTDTQTILVS